MHRTDQHLREDALAIWRAGVEAVRSDRLVREQIRVVGHELLIADEPIDLKRVRQIQVVGAGKAGAGMAAGFEAALKEYGQLDDRVSGWMNVPADCVRPLRTIHLHAARPAGVNEPRPEGVAGAEEILRRVEQLGPDDVCVALISGGASALLPAPAAGVMLDEKLAITRYLSAAGANIAELNTVRKQLSRIKGGGLWRACRAARLITLVISDVPGDPLDIIASGPTVADHSTPAEALAILDRFAARDIAPQAVAFLERRDQSTSAAKPACQATTVVIGNNATAVDAAGMEAERRGYSHAMSSNPQLEGPAEQVGRDLAEMAVAMRSQAGPDCLISGGEPVVKLAPAAERGRGGRNQQLVLAALDVLMEDRDPSGIALLSGGTDGEDGPTDAAGALVDTRIMAAVRRQQLDWKQALRRNDAYTLFDAVDGLIKTGPTHTNVCDLRVVVVQKNVV